MGRGRVAVCAVLAVVGMIVLSGCQQGTMWRGCSVASDGNQFGTDGKYVMACRNGVWEPIMTVSEYLTWNSGGPLTIAPLPKKPAPPRPTTTTTTTPARPPLASTSPVIQVATGSDFGCALHADRTVSCWGADNRYRQLGYVGTPSARPVRVVGLTDIESIHASLLGACALRSDRSVWCWGNDAPGRTLTRMIAPGGATQVALVSGSGACALEPAGTVACWAAGEMPVRVDGIVGLVRVEAGVGHGCGLTADETVNCWGSNPYGQLGRGTTDFDGPHPPGPVPDLDEVVDLAVGSNQRCALVRGGDVYCWGNNFDGAVGRGSYAQPTPWLVAGLPHDAVDVVAGPTSTCALLSDGTAYCWGENSGWALGGNGGFHPINREPLRVFASGSVSSVGLAWRRTCFLDTVGVKCAGEYAGTALYGPPVSVPDLRAA